MRRGRILNSGRAANGALPRWKSKAVRFAHYRILGYAEATAYLRGRMPFIPEGFERLNELLGPIHTIRVPGHSIDLRIGSFLQASPERSALHLSRGSGSPRSR